MGGVKRQFNELNIEAHRQLYSVEVHVRRVAVKHENVRFAVRQAVLDDKVVKISYLVDEHSILHERGVSAALLDPGRPPFPSHAACTRWSLKITSGAVAIPAAFMVVTIVVCYRELERLIPTTFCPLSEMTRFALVPCGITPVQMYMWILPNMTCSHMVRQTEVQDRQNRQHAY